MNAYDAARLNRQAEGLRRLAQALVRDPQAADDLVQDTLIVALKKGGMPTMAWLRGVLRNRVRERARGESRRLRREGQARGLARVPQPPEIAAHIDEQRLVAEALQRVPEPFRTTLWLRFFAGRSPAAIARDQDVAVATVRTRVHRGLAYLRQELDRTHGDRGTWRSLLLPFVPQGGAMLLGGGMAISKLKFGLAAVLIALLGGGAFLGWRLGMGDSEPSRSSMSALQADAVGNEAEGDQPAAQLTGRGSAGLDRSEATEEASVPAPPSGVRVRGRVVVKEGRLPEFVRIYVVEKSAPVQHPPVHKMRVDPKGAFSFSMKSTRGHWIAARAPRNPELYVAFLDGDAFEPGGEIELVLHRARERVIRVHVPDGRPRKGIQVTVLPLDPKTVRGWPRPEDASLHFQVLTTDARGECRVRATTDRAFRVRAVAEHWVAPERIVRPDEAAIDLHLELSAILRIRIEGWKPGDPPITAFVRPADPFAAVPAYGGMKLDGTIVVQDRLAPGFYNVRLHSPVHAETLIEGVRVTHSGEEIELTATMHKKRATGDLILELGDEAGTAPADGSQVFVFWRSHVKRTPVWRARGQHPVRAGRLTIQALAQGQHDYYVVPVGEKRQCGAAHRIWVRDGEQTVVKVALRSGAMRKMPDVATRDMRGARLVHATGELPVFFARRGSSQNYGEVFPPAGVMLGPYPPGPLELHVPSDEGPKRYELAP